LDKSYSQFIRAIIFWQSGKEICIENGGKLKDRRESAAITNTTILSRCNQNRTTCCGNMTAKFDLVSPFLSFLSALQFY